MTPYEANKQWPVRRLADVTLKIGSGATPKGGAAVYLPRREEFAFVRSQNVFDRRFEGSSLAFISNADAARLSNSFLRENDVLLNITGDGVTFGRASRIDPDVLPACVNQHVAIIRADPETLDSGYLLSFFSHPATKEYIASFNSGGSRRAVTKANIESFAIPLPSMPEQRAIAATLGTLDDKIESNQRLCDLVLDLVDAYAAKEESCAPVVELAQLATINRRSVSIGSFGDEVVEHFSLPAFDGGALPELVPASEIRSNKIRLTDRTILVSRLNPRFNRTWWVEPQGLRPSLASPEFAALAPSAGTELAALWMAVRAPRFREELPRRVTGTSGSHQRVRPQDLLSMHVPDVRRIPRERVEAVGSLMSLQQARRRESRKLAELRDALLPELMSGRIRVAEASEAVEEAIGESDG